MHVRKILGAVVASALLFSLDVPASHADTYVPTPVNQDFSGSQGGWTQSADYSGLCLQTLVCPAVYNGWSGGGADGNGYISAKFASLASTVAGTSSSTWESPAFTYNGLGGKTPGSVTFDMNMLRNVGALLDLSVLNDTKYSVDLVDQASGNKVSVIPATLAAPNTSWQAVPSASVSPNLLKIGHNYKIRITTAYHAVVTVIATGEVGYDNVTLTTAAADGGGNTTNNGGSNITDIKQLRQLTKNYILPKSAEVKGHLLIVHLRCPAAASPKPCQIQFAGLQKGKFSKAATARKIVKLKANKERTVKIRIKPKYQSYYNTAKKIWVKIIVRVGRVRVTVRKTMKLTNHTAH
jgi:hypothetical protein